ncbi:MAG: DUF3623 domain-containing protein [Gammaproteobacteria bacterium]|nr:DUF3623 domain-containing protein [Gammaproteobacteria bacterium]
MATTAAPILYALLLWWFSTGAILFLDGLPRSTHRWSMLAATVLVIPAIFGLIHAGSLPGAAGAYLGFTAALLIWGWIEMSFLMGFVTGPRRSDCPPDARGWRRFICAFETIAHHELLLVGTLVGVLWISLGADNAVGGWTFLALWLMRLSTKLNIFLGVRNLNEGWLPEHLGYLASYFSRRRMNPLFPFSIAASLLAVGWVFAAAIAADPGSAEFAALLLVGTLLTLGLLEHVFLVLPITLDGLFRWGFRSRTAIGRQAPP